MSILCYRTLPNLVNASIVPAMAFGYCVKTFHSLITKQTRIITHVTKQKMTNYELILGMEGHLMQFTRYLDFCNLARFHI